MVSNDTVRHVNAVNIILADKTAVGETSAAAEAGQQKVSPVRASAGRGLDGVEQGGPQVRIVVAHLVLHD